MKRFSLKLKKINIPVLFLIILAGAVLRIFNLSGKSLWYDEACSLSFTQYDWKDLFSHRYIAKPVYFFLLKLWVSAFGCSEFWTRFLSVVFGVLSIYLIYKLARELFGHETGIVSALLLSVSSYHIYYSQQARNYTAFLFLGLISMLIFVKLLNKGQKSLFFFFVFTNVLLVYTHAFGIFVIIVQAIFPAIFRKRIKEKRRWITSYLIELAALLPLLFIFVNSPAAPANNEIDYIARPNPRLLVETFEVFGYAGPRQAHAGIGFETPSLRLIIPRILAVILFLLFVRGIISRKRQDGEKSSLLLLWLLFPIFFAYLFSLLISPVYLTRFLILTSAAYYIIIAGTLAQIHKAGNKAVIILAVVVLSFYSLNILYYPGSENDWRKMASYVRPKIKEGDIILLAPVNQIVPFWYYYKYDDRQRLKDIDKNGKKVNGKWSNSFLDGSNLVTGIELKSAADSIIKKAAALKDKQNDIWLVISPDWFGKEASGLLKDRLGSSRVLKETKYFDYSGVEVNLYKRN